MKSTKLKNYEFLLPVTATVLWFFAVKNVIPNIVFALYTILMGLYFFPLKLFLSEAIKKYLFSFFLFSVLSGLAVAISVMHGNQNLILTFKIASIVNFMLLIYVYFKAYDKSVTATYIGFLFFTGAVIGM